MTLDRSAGERPTVLVVDDDAEIRRALDLGLGYAGLRVELAADGAQALQAVAAARPDLVLLDLGLPDVDGVQVTHRLRAGGDDTPICILSARGEVDDRVAGLQAGADDYVVKPFNVRELVARIDALLRRRPVAGSDLLRCGDLRIDPAGREVFRGDRQLGLTNRELELLETFVRNRGVVLSRVRLLELVWGYDFDVDTNVVDVFVGYLRRKLEAGGESRMLHTVRGVGFVLRAS